MYRRLLTVGAVLALTGTLAGAAMASGTIHQTTSVNWHAQQASLGRVGAVAGAWAQLVRNEDRISFQINTDSLTPGNAYTLWLVVVNNPEACDPSPCTAPDIILDPDTHSQVRYAAGHVVGGSGLGTFAGSVGEGPLTGWLPDRSLDDAMAAEVHLVINDHGPMLAGFMPGMIGSYRGGCSDESPFPPIFPDTALGDGEVGPNICRLYQSAVFVAP